MNFSLRNFSYLLAVVCSCLVTGQITAQTVDQTASVISVSNPTWINEQFPLSSPGSGVTFSSSFASVSADAITDRSILDGAVTFFFEITTQAAGIVNGDILLFDAIFESAVGVNQLGGWFNDANGLDTGPQAPNFQVAFAGLTADAWLRTPMSTGSAGAATFEDLGDDDFVTHNDSINNGPQTDFMFAQFTLIPDASGVAEGTFRGQVQVGTDAGVPVRENFEFNLSIAPVPEPGSISLLMTALISMGLLRRRK